MQDWKSLGEEDEDDGDDASLAHENMLKNQHNMWLQHPLRGWIERNINFKLPACQSLCTCDLCVLMLSLLSLLSFLPCSEVFPLFFFPLSTSQCCLSELTVSLFIYYILILRVCSSSHLSLLFSFSLILTYYTITLLDLCYVVSKCSSFLFVSYVLLVIM